MLGTLGLLSSPLIAQTDYSKVGLPFLRDKDAKALENQAAGFYEAIEPLADKTRESAVYIEHRGRTIALGTVTTSGVVTKWSEIKPFKQELFLVGYDGVRRGVAVKSIYNDYDIAVLAYNGSLPAVDLQRENEPDVGSFIYLSGPGKGAHGLGVVSVKSRSLREQDKAFLGVRMDIDPVENGGVRLLSIEPDSAADSAGLKAGDVVQKVGVQNVNSMIEMGNILQRFKPGDKIDLSISRDSETMVANVTLGARPEFRRISPERMNRMRSMGGSVNTVGEGFPDVLQSDMQIEARESGGPVFDLEGKFVGTVVARSSRIKTYIIPADKLDALLKSAPDSHADVVTTEPVLSDIQAEQETQKQLEIKRTRRLIDRLEQRLEELER